jgi:hypothetical protein
MIRTGLIVLLFLFSCTKKTKVPKNILPPNKMEKLLLDLMKADELIIRKSVDSTSSDSFSREVVYAAVFNQYKTSKEEFRKSFSYYERHPDLLKIVLDSMQSETKMSVEQSKAPLKKKKPL